MSAALYLGEGTGSASLTIGDYTYPPWVAVFVWLSSVLSLLPVPVMAVMHWVRVDVVCTCVLVRRHEIDPSFPAIFSAGAP
ncbi:hypothetical protein MTO96_024007 [Rhipicephalus appendiculatus]